MAVDTLTDTQIFQAAKLDASIAANLADSGYPLDEGEQP